MQRLVHHCDIRLREQNTLGKAGETASGKVERRRIAGSVRSCPGPFTARPAVAGLPQLMGLATAGGRPAKQRRGHAQAAKPAAGWIPTDERFRDPTTQAVMRVWIDPADQSRHYVPEPDG